ncbi:glycosyltransferase family 2 protein [Candidatus Microgenomates bacterium]|nr:glycosyltransferase family 2 protein [Candidatus Microgenomates bacterium]
MTYPSVSIIIPTLNAGKPLERCLTSIQALNYPQKRVEVVVVDNGSSRKIKKQKAKSKNTIKNLSKAWPFRLKVIRNADNLGFAKAVNQGVSTSRGTYLFITNDDVILEKDCIKNLIEFILAHPEIGVAGGKIYTTGTKKVWHPAPRYNFYTSLFRDAKDANITQEADWIPGSGLCTSKAIWKKLRGFDEGFFFSFEDLDFCVRAKQAGYKIIYYPQAILWHKDGTTVNRPEFAYFKYYEGYKSKFRFLLKHGTLAHVITSFLLQFLIFWPYRIIVLKEKSTRAVFAALVWNIRNLLQTRNMYEKSFK